jgi:hypothetical protein
VVIQLDGHDAQRLAMTFPAFIAVPQVATFDALAVPIPWQSLMRCATTNLGISSRKASGALVFSPQSS